MRDKGWAKLLRIVAIVLMSLTALFTIMGGAGTSCVALNPAGYGPKFAGIAPFQWLYLLFVAVTLAFGVMGVRAVVLLIRGARNAYRYSMIALVAGAVVGIIHLVASRLLRGGSMPVDMVVYTTIITLVVFLLIRIPAVWQGVNFEKPESAKGSGKGAAAAAMVACGLLALTIQFLMAPTHTIGGVNYADVWHWMLSGIGVALVAGGVGLFQRDAIRSRPSEAELLPDPVS
jgi:uncharacterized membrane protein (UPF0136 family)